MFPQALRHRDFRLFFAGQSVSQLGDMAFFLALTWAALQVADGAAGLGVVLAAYFGAQLLLLLAGGVLVDRFPRRLVVVASDVAQGALVGVLALLAHADLLTLPVLVGFGAAFGAAAAVAMPAVAAYVPDTVPRHHLASATGLYQGLRTATYVAGPALAGLLVAYAGVAAAFALDALTFAASAALLWRATPRGAPTPADERRPVLEDVRGGARYVARQPWIWIAILLFALVNLAETGPRSVGLPLLVEAMQGDAQALGLVQGVAALGALAGALLCGALGKGLRDKRGAVAYAAIAVAGVGVFATGLAGSLVALALAGFLRTGGFAVFAVLWETALGDQVEEGMRGRVNSLDLLGSSMLLPLSTWGAGLAADAFGLRLPILLGGLLVLGLGLVGLAMPQARRYERVPTAEEDEVVWRAREGDDEERGTLT